MTVPENIRPFTVSRLNTAIKARLEEFFPTVWVTGEISNFTRAQSGHLYFSLIEIEPASQIPCCLWRSIALRLNFEPRNGMEVILRAELSVYLPRGEYQLIVQELHPKGIGAAELALRQLKEKLLRKGYFDPRRKRPLPHYPRRIALIASPTGAAIRDMLELLGKRWPVAEAIVRPSRVQGDGAAEELATAIRQLSWLHHQGSLPLDAIVLGRGGGSSEDLAAFNEEIVADAIYESSVPVVSAVGHEIDVSIADLVADARALTPSEAITKLCPDRKTFNEELLSFEARLRETINYRLVLARQRLDKFTDRPAFRKPFDRLRELEQKLDDTSLRLQRAMAWRFRLARDQVNTLAQQLESLSPLNVLHRGYTLTQKPGSEQLLRSATDVQVGDLLRTRLASGQIFSRVEAVAPGDHAQLSTSGAS